MLRHSLLWLPLLLVSLLPSVLQAGEPEFFTDFENDDTPAYTIGDLHSQNGWEVQSGTAAIQDTLAFSGLQAAQFAPENGGRSEFPLPAADSTGGISLSLRSRIGAPDPQLTNEPAEIDFSGARIRFDAHNGLELFDGALGGGTGDWVATGISINSNAWFRVTFRIDHAANTWSMDYQGIPVAGTFGLAPGNPGSPTLFAVQPGNQDLLLDSLIRTAQPPMEDDDQDQLTNLEEEILYGTDSADPDSDGDEVGDFPEIQAGTDPNDPASYLAPVGMVAQNGKLQLRFPTVVDRLYTVEFSTQLGTPNFTPVSDPAFVRVPGTGGDIVFEADIPLGPVIYRVKVDRP